MSTVRRMGSGSGNGAEKNHKHHAPEVRMCEPAQIYNRRSPDWPFMYSYEKGKCFVNTAPRKSAYAQATEAGPALL